MIVEYIKVPAETYFAQSADTIVYGDIIQNALAPLTFDTLDAVVALVPRRLEMVLLMMAMVTVCVFTWKLRRL